MKIFLYLYKHEREYRRCNLKMDNQEKLAAQGTQDEEKQNKNLTQYVPDTTTRKQTHTTNKNKT